MKEVKAIIQIAMLEKVLHALHRIDGLPGCIVSRVEGFGRDRRVPESDQLFLKSAEFAKLEVVVRESLVPDVVKVIEKNARTGNPEDGKIFVIETVEVVRIRTGERGDAAI